jgi:hypothetical protein
VSSGRRRWETFMRAIGFMGLGGAVFEIPNNVIKLTWMKEFFWKYLSLSLTGAGDSIGVEDIR